ncbi:unnamed protein product [Calicophoron daubneyi]|uniref:Uncharacterized protein n=1 Tax=Calicophoron daubneyi TaxID=300641 RepID=A0AAV2TC09_CALDB
MNRILNPSLTKAENGCRDCHIESVVRLFKNPVWTSIAFRKLTIGTRSSIYTNELWKPVEMVQLFFGTEHKVIRTMCYAGTVEQHIKHSDGGNCDPLSHYCTAYNTSYGQHWESFQSRKPAPPKSGFVSNVRPVVQFDAQMDGIDNPTFANVIKMNYVSVTKKDYTSLELPARRATVLALTELQFPSKYDRTRWKLGPAAINEELNISLVSPTPKHRPLLCAHKKVEYADSENFGFGPNHQWSTYKSTFATPSSKDYNLSRTNIGRMEETGSTRNNSSTDTLTGRSNPVYSSNSWRGRTDRPTGRTVYSDTFVAYAQTDRTAPFPRRIALSAKNMKNSYVEGTKVFPEYVQVHPAGVYGHVNEISEDYLEKLKKTNPAEYQNVIHAFKEPSIQKGIFLGEQNPPLTHADHIGNRTVGPAESSGFTKNVLGHLDTDNLPPDRLVTHKHTRFYPPPPAKDSENREGHIHFNTQQPNPKTSSTEINVRYMEPQIPSTEKLGIIPPYQSRSVIARDTFPKEPPKNIF